MYVKKFAVFSAPLKCLSVVIFKIGVHILLFAREMSLGYNIFAVLTPDTQIMMQRMIGLAK